MLVHNLLIETFLDYFIFVSNARASRVHLLGEWVWVPHLALPHLGADSLLGMFDVGQLLEVLIFVNFSLEDF